MSDLSHFNKILNCRCIQSCEKNVGPLCPIAHYYPGVNVYLSVVIEENTQMILITANQPEFASIFEDYVLLCI